MFKRVGIWLLWRKGSQPNARPVYGTHSIIGRCLVDLDMWWSLQRWIKIHNRMDKTEKHKMSKKIEIIMRNNNYRHKRYWIEQRELDLERLGCNENTVPVDLPRFLVPFTDEELWAANEAYLLENK